MARTVAEVVKYMEAPGGDRVAQRYIGRPLLLAGGRKFDLRCYIMVRSLVPLDAFLHMGFYARYVCACVHVCLYVCGRAGNIISMRTRSFMMH